MKKLPCPSQINRRSFVKLIPAAGAAGTVIQHAGASAIGQAPAPASSQKISQEILHVAERIFGLEFKDAEEKMALASVNRNLSAYESLRGVTIPLDTEPAVAFHPALPGRTFHPRGVKYVPLKKSALSYKSVEDLAFATAVQLADLLRAKKVTSVELTRMYLSRLKRFGPKLNCIVTLTEELAMKQAEQADAEIRRGRYRGPLHGIPWGAKDLFATRGIRTTWGAEPYKDQVIDYDAAVVERLRDAGAVLIAKLSMGALAQGGLWFGGMTKNPWKTEDSSSGSSAGPASATAAGLVGFSVGTETLGSIITPSSICGCTSLRPTYGRVSRYGAMGLSWTMDKIGPICRGVEDCAAVLDAIYGRDGRDLTVTDIPFRWEPAAPLGGMRIGFLKDEFEQGTDERKAIYTVALDALRKAGAKLEPAELPKFPAQSLRFILVAEAAAAFDDLTRSRGIDQLSGQAPGDWPNTFRASRFIPAVEYLRGQRARTLLMREMEKFMANWDVFVSPAPGSSSLLVTNLTGHPAVVLPCGFNRDLPQALMFTGGLYDEGMALRAALAFEQATDWHSRHPKVDWA